MRPLIFVACCVSMSGCVYVTKSEYESYWDQDGDGWPLDDDCNDQNASVYPHAPDLRGDGCDADCGRESDVDGDDWPDPADCDADDPTIYPCSPEEVEGDGIDHDCDGHDSIRVDTCRGNDPDFVDPPAPNLGDCPGGATEE
jgi:hypothetical protein